MRRLGCIGALAVFVIAAIGFFQMEYGTKHNVTFTVSKLDDQSNGSSGHKYLVFTTDNRVYENTDAWLHGKTDSSQIWAEMSVGQTWDCPEYGYRNTFLSSYPDLLDGCKLIAPAKAGTPAS